MNGTYTNDPVPAGSATNTDHRARLETLRDQLTAAIAVCETRALPQLARQLRSTLTDLAALPPEVTGAEPGSIADLQARRAARQNLPPATPVASDAAP